MKKWVKSLGVVAMAASMIIASGCGGEKSSGEVVRKKATI